MYLMPSILHLLRYIFILITPYNDVKSTMENPTQIKSLVNKFSAQCAICLMIYTHQRTYIRTNAHQGKSTFAALILSAILFTGRISLAFDGLNEEQLTMQLRIIGPEIYTMVNMLPTMVLQLMLLYEIFTTSSSIALAILIALSFFALGIASFIVAVVMEKLMSVPVVTTDTGQQTVV
ncbi:hypothetical protein BDQ17DRAFT_1329062 [Cyathus striatus]|nr:hypothetical protein BDQ17DRAFT_1329062 [Cyathus striatus]